MKVVGDNEGRDLPTRAERFIEHAEAHGWKAMAQWQHNHHEETFVTIQVGRAATAQELADFAADANYGEIWTFSTTWHSRNAPVGKLRMFGRTLGSTPQRPQASEYTLTQVMEIITQYPHPDTTTHRWG